MLALVLAGLLTMQGDPAAQLAETPQGRRVQAYIEAFNKGDDQAFLAWFEKAVTPEALKRRTAEERLDVYKRIRGDFGKLVVRRVTKMTADQVQVVIPTADGQGEGTFTFDFEPAPPHRITGIGIDVQAGDR